MAWSVESLPHMHQSHDESHVVASACVPRAANMEER